MKVNATRLSEGLFCMPLFLFFFFLPLILLSPKATLMRSDYHLNQKISGPTFLGRRLDFSPRFASQPFVGFAACSCTLRPRVLFERRNARLMFYSLLLFGRGTSGRLGRGAFVANMAEIKEKMHLHVVLQF